MSKLKSALIMIALTGCFAPPPIGGEGDLVDADGDGYTADSECNDGDDLVFPNAPERCNGIDDNCNGLPDEGGVCVTTPTDNDGDGDPDSTDCNDINPAIRHGANEVCNNIDDDCDNSVDEGVQGQFYPDADGDGFGRNTPEAILACTMPPGHTSDHTDCDDSQPLRAPGRLELCDGLDNDCDGLVDASDDSVQGECAIGNQIDCFEDEDGDGFGRAPSFAFVGSACPTGWVEVNHDCNDDDDTIFPGAEEICGNGIDDDCDPEGSAVRIDEGCVTTTVSCYVDGDADGTGVGSTVPRPGTSCGSGYSPVGGDCDDADALEEPGNVEVCGDSKDNDCNTSTSDTCPTTVSCYVDSDGDTWGTGVPTPRSGACLTNEAPRGGDCADSNTPANRLINPGATEACNGLDDNCAGGVDEGLVFVTWYRDQDGDNYGDINDTQGVSACSQPSGKVSTKTDCDDSHSAVRPNATEVCDGVDNDCDYGIDEGGVCPVTPVTTYSNAKVCLRTAALDDNVSAVRMYVAIPTQNDWDGWYQYGREEIEFYRFGEDPVNSNFHHFCSFSTFVLRTGDVVIGNGTAYVGSNPNLYATDAVNWRHYVTATTQLGELYVDRDIHVNTDANSWVDGDVDFMGTRQYYSVPTQYRDPGYLASGQTAWVIRIP